MYPFLQKKLRKLTAVMLCTAVALAIPTPVHQVQAGSGTYGKNDVMVLAKMIHGEARGESYVGKVAVGAVILNRVEDKKFPDSVYSVCFQPGAFDAVRDGSILSGTQSGGHQCCQSGYQRLGPHLWLLILLESFHCHQQVDLVPPYCNPNWQACVWSVKL